MTEILSFIAGFFAERILSFLYERFNAFMKKMRHRRQVDLLIEGQGEDINIQTLRYFYPPIDKGKSQQFTVNVMDPTKNLFLRPSDEKVRRLEEERGFTFSESPHQPEALESFLEKDPSKKELLDTTIKQVADKIINNPESVYFNGLRYGVFQSDFYNHQGADEETNIQICLYGTDYFSHLVMESYEQALKAIQKDIKIEDLNKQYPFLRTSIGVSVILYSQESKQILLTKRSQNARYTENKPLYYVSATEAISQADYDPTTDSVNLFQAVERGLMEELGIDETLIQDIVFLSYFFEHNFTQDGLVAVAVLKEGVNLAEVLNKPAKDKTLEVDQMFIQGAEKGELMNWLNKNRENCQYQTIYSLEIFASYLGYYFN